MPVWMLRPLLRGASGSAPRKNCLLTKRIEGHPSATHLAHANLIVLRKTEKVVGKIHSCWGDKGLTGQHLVPLLFMVTLDERPQCGPATTAGSCLRPFGAEAACPVPEASPWQVMPGLRAAGRL